MTITTEQTQDIHRHYVAVTGLDVPFSMQRHYAWEKWLAHGLTESDLDLIVRYIKRRISKRRREKESLLFRNLIERPDNALEDLSIARAESREPVKTERTRVLESTGRKEPEKLSMIPAQIMENHTQMAELLRQYREGM